MANYLTGAQRYNNRMEKIWKKATMLRDLQDQKEKLRELKKKIKELGY